MKKPSKLGRPPIPSGLRRLIQTIAETNPLWRAPAFIQVKLSELLEGVVALIEETIAKGRRNIQLLPGFEGEIEAFPSDLRQVFTNVIKNAVEATADGGDIRIYSEAVQESGTRGVLIRAVDNGVGVPEELHSRLFSPFVSTKEERGTGLGLWVSRNILERHGGRIELSSSGENGVRGTTVSIFLPRVPAATPRFFTVS